jgi:hypothetical protein
VGTFPEPIITLPKCLHVGLIIADISNSFYSGRAKVVEGVELDNQVGRIGGQTAQLVVLEDVARGAYQLEPFGAADIAAARTIIERYADLQLGLTDASLVVLAERYGCHDLVTLDGRHFRAILCPLAISWKRSHHASKPRA